MALEKRKEEGIKERERERIENEQTSTPSSYSCIVEYEQTLHLAMCLYFEDNEYEPLDCVVRLLLIVTIPHHSTLLDYLNRVEVAEETLYTKGKKRIIFVSSSFI